MISISGVKNREERALIREFTIFTLSSLVIESKIKKSIINIKAIKPEDLPEDQQKEFKECEAWMSYEGKVRGRKKFDVEINVNYIDRSLPLRARMKEFLLMLSHELIHVKQYLNGELFDYADGIKSRFKGKLYMNPTKMDWDYYNLPYEVEAYGRSVGMYNLFCACKWE